ncbi:MAG: DUF721 domain-containing protein [bacterium]
MRRTKKVERIDVVLDRVLKASGLENAFLEQRVISLLPEIFDKRIMAHIKSYHMEDRILFIKLDSPVWARELLFLKKEMMDKINNSLTKKYIKNVMFKS